MQPMPPVQVYTAPAPAQPNPRASTFGEGFTFGCGFLLAGFLASVGMGLALLLLSVIMTAIGVALFPR